MQESASGRSKKIFGWFTVVQWAGFYSSVCKMQPWQVRNQWTKKNGGVDIIQNNGISKCVSPKDGNTQIWKRDNLNDM